MDKDTKKLLYIALAIVGALLLILIAIPSVAGFHPFLLTKEFQVPDDSLKFLPNGPGGAENVLAKPFKVRGAGPNMGLDTGSTFSTLNSYSASFFKVQGVGSFSDENRNRIPYKFEYVPFKGARLNIEHPQDPGKSVSIALK